MIAWVAFIGAAVIILPATIVGYALIITRGARWAESQAQTWQSGEQK